MSKKCLIMLASALALLAGCAESPSALPTGLTGRWGGLGAELIAEPRSVRASFDCGVLIARRPLFLDGDRFVLPVEGSSFNSSPRSITLRGVVSDSTITFDVITITAGSTFTASYTVTRDRPIKYKGFACIV